MREISCIRRRIPEQQGNYFHPNILSGEKIKGTENDPGHFQYYRFLPQIVGTINMFITTTKQHSP